MAQINTIFPEYDGIVDRGRAVGVGPSRKAKLQSIIISKWHFKKMPVRILHKNHRVTFFKM